MNIRFAISQIKKQIKICEEDIETESRPEIRILLHGQIQGLKRSLQILGE